MFSAIMFFNFNLLFIMLTSNFLFSNNSELFIFKFFIQTFITNFVSKIFQYNYCYVHFLSTFLLKLYFHFVVQKRNCRTFLNYFLLYISFTTSIVFLVFKLMNHNFDGFAGIGSPSICVVWTNGSQLAGQKVMIGSGLKWTAQKPIYGRP